LTGFVKYYNNINMKQIIFFKDKLVVEIPNYYEYSFESGYSLALYYPKNKSFNIKFIVVDSNENSEQLVFYNNKKTEKYLKKKFILLKIINLKLITTNYL
jgi:hypothetical protein